MKDDQDQLIQQAHTRDQVPVDVSEAWEFFKKHERIALDYGVLNIVVDVDDVRQKTKKLIRLERKYEAEQSESALRVRYKLEIIQLRSELGLGLGKFQHDDNSAPVPDLPQRDLVRYDSEFDEDDNYDDDDYEVRRTDSCQREQRFYDCYGCAELDAGTGGENQMAHMGPGGCLYEEDEEQVSRTISRSNSDYYFTDEGSAAPALWDFVEGSSFSRKL